MSTVQNEPAIAERRQSPQRTSPTTTGCEKKGVSGPQAPPSEKFFELDEWGTAPATIHNSGPGLRIGPHEVTHRQSPDGGESRRTNRFA